MSVGYRFLDRGSFPAVYRTFVRAFADYALDMTYMTEERMLNRAIKNGVDFESSVGAHSAEGMVGFTLIGVDRWKGAPSAFDIGTGVIQRFRGMGVAQAMFDFAVPRLVEKGVERFVLEVLQENEPAIRAYEKSGFEIVREFDCFRLQLGDVAVSTSAQGSVAIRTVDRDRLSSFADALDWPPSWENSFESIRRIPDRVVLYEAVSDRRPAGLLVYYPGLSWIMTLLVKRSERRRGIGRRLVGHLIESIGDRESDVRVVNVQRDDQGTQSLLAGLGFRRYVSQYEMELQL
ncbi:MAG: GNAT family N-acetyltransferase [Gemmatimonadetes bacterium]|nr:GNAT family N-acetyltransferase [Gemmatimonadota bacterium]NIO30668.1 GNAT family N-acetyltransferase [Gemmatimonadota bacterium]